MFKREYRFVESSNVIKGESDLRVYTEPGFQLRNVLMQIEYTDFKNIRIFTYSLPNKRDAIQWFLDRIGERHIDIIFNSKFIDEAKRLGLNDAFNITLYPKLNFHAKAIVMDNGVGIFGSCNFGESGWAETIIHIKADWIWHAMDIYFGRVINAAPKGTGNFGMTHADGDFPEEPEFPPKARFEHNRAPMYEKGDSE